MGPNQGRRYLPPVVLCKSQSHEEIATRTPHIRGVGSKRGDDRRGPALLLEGCDEPKSIIYGNRSCIRGVRRRDVCRYAQGWLGRGGSWTGDRLTPSTATANSQNSCDVHVSGDCPSAEINRMWASLMHRRGGDEMRMISEYVTGHVGPN